MALALLVVGLFIFVGHLLTEVFKRTHIPDVLVLMLIGIMLGPHALNLVRPEDFGKVGPALTTIALIVILFHGGTQMRLSTVGRSLGPTLALMAPTLLVTIGIVASVTRPFLGSWPLAFTLGAVLSGPSSAVVMPMVESLRMGDRAKTILALESAFTDVISIVTTVALLDALTTGRFETGRMVTHMISSLGVATIVGVVGGIGWLIIRARLKSFPNTIFTVFAYVFILFGADELLGFSGAISALAFGITTSCLTKKMLVRLGLPSNMIEEFSSFEHGIFAEAVFLLKLFFFVYLGMMLHFEARPLVLGAVIVGAVNLARFVITWLVLTRQASRRDAAITGVMVPQGLAAAVLALMVAQSGVPGSDQLQMIAFSVVLWSITATSLFIPLIEMASARPLIDRIFAHFAPSPAPSLEPADVPSDAPALAPTDPPAPG